MDLVPEEDPTGKGTVFIPFSVDDLASNEYVVARGLHAGAGGARGKQIFGHDFAIETLLPNGEWTRLVAGVTEATENAHHRVFGRTVLAIADGEIDEAVDHHPDNPLGAKNKNPNFMWIRHGKMQVYYSHLKQNSIKVRSGRVVAGQRLAEVGNSGNTNGIPHLHMHGQDADSITLRGFAFKRAKILERAQVISSGPDAWVWLNTRGIPRERCAVRPSEHRTIPDLGREFELAKLWVAEVFGGVAQGGDGFVLVGGKIVKVPPRGPKWALLQSLIALEAAEKIDHPSAQKIIEEIAETIANLANELKKQR
jgi:hypothetical protein